MCGVPMDPVIISARTESWPIRGEFRIARGAKTEAHVVVVEARSGYYVGRGEATPYSRYGESVEGVLASVSDVALRLPEEAPRAALQKLLQPGAARNALDCALWDLEAQMAGLPFWQYAGLPEPLPQVTALTISLDTPEAMAKAAAAVADRPLLKVKVDDAAALAGVAAIHAAAPASALIIDGNEALSAQTFERLAAKAREWNIVLVEQPFPVDRDEVLAGRSFPVCVCADESAHATEDLETLVRRYDAVNIKLDKTGGLTEGIEMARRARQFGMKVMIGCMVGTSLGMAPAANLLGFADFADLDGPLLLANDRSPGLIYDGWQVTARAPGLWG